MKSYPMLLQPIIVYSLSFKILLLSQQLISFIFFFVFASPLFFIVFLVRLSLKIKKNERKFLAQIKWQKKLHKFSICDSSDLDNDGMGPTAFSFFVRLQWDERETVFLNECKKVSINGIENCELE